MSQTQKFARVAPALFLTALLLLPSTQVFAAERTASKPPLDLRDHWAASYVLTMLERGMIQGYPNGRFYPEQILSREEACSLLYQLLAARCGCVPSVRSEPVPYLDLAGCWSRDIIAALWQAGILEDGTQFSPTNRITRGEMSRYTARALELIAAEEIRSAEQLQLDADGAADALPLVTENDASAVLTPPGEDVAETESSTAEETADPPADPVTSPFHDIYDSPDMGCILALYEGGIVSGFDDGGFHPNASLSRAEGVTILYRASGYPLTSSGFAPLPAYNVIPVPYISQIYPVNAPVGCEPVSLLMGLQAKGYAQSVSVSEFLDAMPKTASNPAKGFVGSPYVPDKSKKTRTTIYPPALTDYGQHYGNVIDLSGASTYEIQREILSGNPVVAYVTLYWAKPYYRYFDIEGETQRLLSNNHAVLVCGYDAAAHQYYIADPYNVNNRQKEYFYWMDGGTFDWLYLERRHALAVD